jgi:hypothetical protein
MCPKTLSRYESVRRQCQSSLNLANTGSRDEKMK